MPSGIVQACTRCRTQKRKCDRRLPVCSLCKRLRRACSYLVLEGDFKTQQAHSLPVPAVHELPCTNIEGALYKQMSAIIGDGEQTLTWATEYFRTIHPWLPAISQTFYYRRLVSAQIASESADFCLLNLTMYLVCTKPVNEELPSEAQSLYVLVKSLVGTLEAVGISSIEMLQSRLLITIFEVGHGLYPAAYISSGANVRAAIELGINAASPEQLLKTLGSQERAEEAQRTWRAIVVTDRYATLHRSTRPYHNLEPFLEEDENTSDAVVEQLDPLTQASQLLEQVRIHIHKETLDHTTKSIEGLQILGAIIAFLAQCIKESPEQSAILSSAVAVCRSAMLEILEYGSKLKPPSIDDCNKSARDVSLTLVKEIAQGAEFTLCKPIRPPVDDLPVFITHCICKAGLVYVQAQTVRRDGDDEVSLWPIINFLKYISKRWIVAAKYRTEIDALCR